MNMVLGISKRRFTLDQEEVFRVYGENLGDPNPADADPENEALELTVKLESTNFVWDPAEYIVDNADREMFYVVIRSTPRVPDGAPPPAASTADHVKVSLTLDIGGADEDFAEEDYNVRFDS